MATKKKLPAKKAAKKPAPRKAAFKAGGPGGRKAGAKAGPKADRKLPRKHGPRRKTPRSIGREAAPAPAPARAELPDESRATALVVAQAGLDKKAEDVTVFDVRGLSSYADYLVIMTADSDRQASAIADSVDDKMKEAGHSKIAVEGYESGTWIIVDYGDVVAHVMSRDSRGFYDLDGLWADAPRFTVDA
ncbi:MAG TPA: ribosome silencing factor [Anaeromyxobacteraceae bacterium]|nr:ribosome silencing factor [Anaeromyxobacteraceae bacterium]